MSNTHDGLYTGNAKRPANQHDGLFRGPDVPDSHVDPNSIGPNNPRPGGDTRATTDADIMPLS